MRHCPTCGPSHDDQVRSCPRYATTLSSGAPAAPGSPAREAGPGAQPFLLGRRLRETPTGLLHEGTLPGGGKVLVKIVPSRTFPSPGLRERALRELRLLAGLAAPGLLAVRGCGLLPEGPLYVLLTPPPAGAEPLDERLRADGILAPDQARHIVIGVLSALAAAADRGVLHRNLAPYAVLVDDQDEVLLGDFGVCEFHEVGWRVLQGAPPFLAPEQAEGRPPTERSLVYAAAALYYYLLTGVPPHGEGDTAELLRRIRAEAPVPPSTRRSGLSREIDAVVLRALDRQPEQRHPGLRELREELEALADILPARLGSQGPTPGWLLPSLGEEAGPEDTEQVAEEDMVAVSWVAPAPLLSPDLDDEPDLHDRETAPLVARRPVPDLVL